MCELFTLRLLCTVCEWGPFLVAKSNRVFVLCEADVPGESPHRHGESMPVWALSVQRSL